MKRQDIKYTVSQMGFFRKLPEPRFPHRGLSIIGHRGCDSQLLIGPNHSRVISAPRLFVLINCRTSRYHREHFYSRQPGSLHKELFSLLHESPFRMALSPILMNSAGIKLKKKFHVHRVVTRRHAFPRNIQFGRLQVPEIDRLE